MIRVSLNKAPFRRRHLINTLIDTRGKINAVRAHMSEMIVIFDRVSIVYFYTPAIRRSVSARAS